MGMHLETERLLLREPQRTDAERLMEIRNSEFVQRYNAMRIIDLERTKRQIIGDIEHRSAVYLVLKEEDRLIGGIWMEDDDKRYEIGAKYLSFYLDEPYARRGYMKEALRALIGRMFAEDPELELIASSVFSENEASQNLLRSLGFTCEGCLRRAVRDPRGRVHDDVQFSLLREEWK